MGVDRLCPVSARNGVLAVIKHHNIGEMIAPIQNHATVTSWPYMVEIMDASIYDVLTHMERLWGPEHETDSLDPAAWRITGVGNYLQVWTRSPEIHTEITLIWA